MTVKTPEALSRAGIQVLDLGNVLSVPVTNARSVYTASGCHFPLENGICIAKRRNGECENQLQALQTYREELESHFVEIRRMLAALIGMGRGFNKECMRAPFIGEVGKAKRAIAAMGIVVSPYSVYAECICSFLDLALQAFGQQRSRYILEGWELAVDALGLCLHLSPQDVLFSN